MDPADVARFLDTWGVLGVLLIIIFAGYRGIWIFKREHEEVRHSLERERDEAFRDRDWWRDVGTRALSIGEAAVGRRDENDGP